MKPSLENIFEPLKDAKANAPSHLWNNIQDELIVHNASQKIKQSHKSPSNKVWHRIQHKLLIHNFLHFSYNTFNVYYLLLLLLGIGSSFYLFNNNLQKEKDDKNTTKQVMASIYPNKTHQNTPNNNASSNTEQAKQKDNNVIKQLTNKKEVQKIKKQHISENNENICGKVIKHKTGIINYNHSNISLYKEDTTKLVSARVLNSPVDTFIVYDTITYFDTIKVLQSVPQEDIDFDHGSIGYYSYGGFLSTTLSPISDAHKSLAEKNDNAITAQGMYSIMIEGKLKIASKLYFGTGIGFSQYFEKFEYKYAEQVVDTHYIYNQYETTSYIYNQHNYIKYDTTKRFYSLVYGTDSSEIVDTIWNYHIDTIIFSVTDSTLITQKDSQLIPIIDTTEKVSFYHYINHYSYVQIPIFFSYSYQINNNWNINLTGGVIANVLINAKGYGISLNDIYQPVELDKLPFLKMYFNYYSSIGIGYKLNKHFSFNADLYYGSTIGNVFQDSYGLRKKFNFAGLKAGISYGF